MKLIKCDACNDEVLSEHSYEIQFRPPFRVEESGGPGNFLEWDLCGSCYFERLKSVREIK